MIVIGVVFESFLFDVNATERAIIKTKMMTIRITIEAMTMGLNHFDWQMEALLSLLYAKEKIYFTDNVVI